MALQQRRVEAECVRRRQLAATRSTAEATQREKQMQLAAARERWNRDGDLAQFPLHLAVCFGNSDDVLRLLGTGVEVLEYDESGKTVIDHLRCDVNEGAYQIRDLVLRHYDSHLPEYQRQWWDALHDADLSCMQSLYAQHGSQLELHALVSDLPPRGPSVVNALTLLWFRQHNDSTQRRVVAACRWILAEVGSHFTEHELQDSFFTARAMGHTFLVEWLLQSQWSALCYSTGSRVVYSPNGFIQQELESAAWQGLAGQCRLIIEAARQHGYPIAFHEVLKKAVQCSERTHLRGKTRAALRICTHIVACDRSRAAQAVHTFADWNDNPCSGNLQMWTPLEKTTMNLESLTNTRTNPQRQVADGVCDDLASLCELFKQLSDPHGD